jgi:hypothetical protein
MYFIIVFSFNLNLKIKNQNNLAKITIEKKYLTFFFFFLFLIIICNYISFINVQDAILYKIKLLYKYKKFIFIYIVKNM